MKEGRKPEYLEKTPGDELQKMPHTKARRFKPQERLEPAQQHCGSHLFGLVVKASTSRVEDPATLPDAWRYRVDAGTGWPGVSIL